MCVKQYNIKPKMKTEMRKFPPENKPKTRRQEADSPEPRPVIVSLMKCCDYSLSCFYNI